MTLLEELATFLSDAEAALRPASNDLADKAQELVGRVRDRLGEVKPWQIKGLTELAAVYDGDPAAWPIYRTYGSFAETDRSGEQVPDGEARAFLAELREQGYIEGQFHPGNPSIRFTARGRRWARERFAI